MTRLGQRCRYRDSIKTLTDLYPQPISGGEWSKRHKMNSVWYGSSDNCKIGWSGFFLTYRANSAIWIGNKWNDFDWTDLVRLDSFCLDFLVWMTQRDFDILWRMLRQRLIETRIYVGCHDRASSRLIILDVETQESSRLRNFLSRPRPVETGQKTPSRRSLIFALKHGSCYQAIFFLNPSKHLIG